ncbi:MAG: hypothetical protein QXF82_03325 [Nitrososphaeria archaeon]
MLRETKQYEEEVKASLKKYFQNLKKKVEIVSQWIPFKEEGEVGKYSPRVDIAVGPFAYGDKQYIQEYDKLTNISRELLNKFFNLFRENSKNFSFCSEIPTDCNELNKINQNARCFMAIEIEKSGSRKHRIGDIVNACSLGRVGIIIAWDLSVLRSFLKITEYFSFLKGKRKPTYETRNLVIVSKEQFSESLCYIKSDSSEEANHL